MRGLGRIPTHADLQQAYDHLQGAEPVSERDFALFSQWVRFDPRLGEIWLERFRKDWKELRFAPLREAIQEQPWPQCVGVLLEQLLDYYPVSSKSEKCALVQLKRALMNDTKKANHESFFIGLAPFASRSMERDAERSLRSYRRWGYFGRDPLLNKAALRRADSVSPRTELDLKTRCMILERLIQENERFTVADYMQRLEGGSSLRLAQRDLITHPALKAVGRTRGRFYVVVKRGKKKSV